MKRYLPSYDTCFVCGKKNSAGLRLCLYVENGSVMADFTPRKEHCGFSGILHGGIISCIIDEALWWSSAVAAGRLVVTRDLEINYRKSLTLRKAYRVEADAPKFQRRIYKCRGRILDRNGSVCIEGAGVYVPLRWGKNRDPETLLSYVDASGNPLPGDSVYRFAVSDT